MTEVKIHKIKFARNNAEVKKNITKLRSLLKLSAFLKLSEPWLEPKSQELNWDEKREKGGTGQLSLNALCNGLSEA